MPALKKKQKSQDDEEVVELEIEEAFDPAETKEDDFEDIELDLDSGQYKGKKGQAGSRRRDK